MSNYVPSLDLWVEITDLPNGVNGFTTRDGMDSTYILINEHLSECEKLKTLLHEMVHFIRGDLDSDESREEVEQDVVISR